MTDKKREELYMQHRALAQDALSLMMAKNQDYGKQTDPFANFRRHGAKGIMVRLDDKFCRMDSFIEKKFNAVSNETVRDTILDGINYLVLLYAFLRAEGLIHD